LLLLMIVCAAARSIGFAAKWESLCAQVRAKYVEWLFAQCGCCAGSAEAESTDDRMMRLQGAAPTIKYA
jgi:hypothetical protein